MKDTGLPARQAALSILSGVLQKRRSLDAQLEQLAGLEARDAGFARALVSQTLRHMGALDAVLRKFLAKPLAPHKAGVATEILLLGACELLILKVPSHAAVDAANQLATKDAKAVHFKPLINAVLRKVASQGAMPCCPGWTANACQHAGLAVDTLDRRSMTPAPRAQIARAHQERSAD